MVRMAQGAARHSSVVPGDAGAAQHKWGAGLHVVHSAGSAEHRQPWLCLQRTAQVVHGVASSRQRRQYRMLQAVHGAAGSTQCMGCVALRVVHTATGSARGCRQCGVQAAHDTAGDAWQRWCTVMQTQHSTGSAGDRLGRVQALHSAAGVHGATGGAGHKGWRTGQVVHGAVGSAQRTSRCTALQALHGAAGGTQHRQRRAQALRGAAGSVRCCRWCRVQSAALHCRQRTGPAACGAAGSE